MPIVKKGGQETLDFVADKNQEALPFRSDGRAHPENLVRDSVKEKTRIEEKRSIKSFKNLDYVTNLEILTTSQNLSIEVDVPDWRT